LEEALSALSRPPLFLLITILAILILRPTPVVAQDDAGLGKISVSKSASYSGGKIVISLQISNIGQVPVSQLSLNEYFNKEFTVPERANLKYAGRTTEVLLGLGAGGLVSQAIVDISPEISLAPGEQIELQYEMVSSKVGDFLIPTTLVSYSFAYGKSLITTNIYSNGLLVHIPSAFELAVQGIIPYGVSSGSGVVIFVVLHQMYKYLREKPKRIGLRKK
jgi:hypothetical protein